MNLLLMKENGKRKAFLMIVAAVEGHIDSMLSLLKDGADVNFEDYVSVSLEWFCPLLCR